MSDRGRSFVWPARVGVSKQGLRICKGCGTAAFCSSCRGDLWHSEDAIHERVYGAQVTGSLLWHYRLDARSARCWPNCHLASDTTRCMKEGLLVCRGCALRLQACQDHARSQGIEEHDHWQQLVCCALSISRLLRLLHSISSEDACLCLSTVLLLPITIPRWPRTQIVSVHQACCGLAGRFRRALYATRGHAHGVAHQSRSLPLDGL